MSQTHLQYAIHREDGSIISRRGDELAWPILDYEAIGQDGNYNAPLKYDLNKIGVHTVGGREWNLLVFTKFVPVEFKNKHREFWGLKPLPVTPLPRTIKDLCREHKVNIYYVHPDGEIGIRHGTWGSGVCLYHWFKKTSKGYVLFDVTDNVEDKHKAATERRLPRKTSRV